MLRASSIARSALSSKFVFESDVLRKSAPRCSRCLPEIREKPSEIAANPAMTGDLALRLFVRSRCHKRHPSQAAKPLTLQTVTYDKVIVEE